MITGGKGVPASDPADTTDAGTTADAGKAVGGSRATAPKASPAKKTTAKRATAAKKTASATKAVAKKATAVTKATAKKAASAAKKTTAKATAGATADEPATTDSGENATVPAAAALEAATPPPTTDPSATDPTDSPMTKITPPAGADATDASEPAGPTAPAGPSGPARDTDPTEETGTPHGTDEPSARVPAVGSAATGAPSESPGIGTSYPVGAPHGIVVADRAASGRTPEPEAQPSTVRRILDHPGYTPELLALAAVRGLGPEARAWAAWVRAAYPGATADGLVRLATRRYVRLAAAGGALSTATGMLAPLAELAAVTWAQAGLVLHLAAAHDHDPTRPDRAADLLVLTRVHPDVASARAALAAAEAAIADHPEDPGPATDDTSTEDVDAKVDAEVDAKVDREPGRLAEAGWRLGAPIVARTANWLALRLAVRRLRLPGAMTLAAAMLSSANTERLAARTVEYYRTGAGWPDPAGRPAVALGGEPAAYNQSNHSRGSSA
ncbi:hypothetical protein [Plantactinospora mayteni]|uniref:Uncharacterized protein n=1 Tax=Plantactinospora mayteni TaxID=566021 RepID=A0ABQ4EU93_9ACTN|nr:hypothetical protein [Plantactinospora mayteni]GIG98222.1 hypothetical protein Pma05_47950 [Plantactinospora mayteni]